MIQRKNITVEEWEAPVGRQVRTARVASGLVQAQLAAMANVSLATLSNLERGKGSTLKTVIAVVRALGRTDWLENFAPEVTVSPMQMLRAKRSSQAPVRVRPPGKTTRLSDAVRAGRPHRGQVLGDARRCRSPRPSSGFYVFEYDRVVRQRRAARTDNDARGLRGSGLCFRIFRHARTFDCRR